MLILIDITDKENTLLDDNQKIKEISGSGTLMVKNPSTRSRLWNLDLNLRETVNIDLEKAIEVGQLNPDQEFKKDYQLKEMDKPILTLEEIFDTNRNISNIVNNSFIYNQSNPCKLTINLTNTLDVPIVEVNVSRIMLPSLQNLEIPTPNYGNAEIVDEGGKKVLNWTIDVIPAKETATVEIMFDSMINNSEMQSLGATKITYLANDAKIAMIDPEIRGLTDSLSGVSTDEGASPGTWDCNVEFINESEFKVRLEKVDVSHNIATGAETIVSETPDIKLEPDDSWDFDFQVESENVPQLESSVEFTTLFEVVTRIIGEINKEATYYPVLRAEIEKAILPPEVDAYANTDMQIENTITNSGTSHIDALIISDSIPKDFIPPEEKNLKLLLEGADGEIEIHEREEFIESLDITPDDQNPDSAHQISIKLKDLANHFVPNNILKYKYPMRAKNPKPEVKYPTPIEIRINSAKKGDHYVKSPETEPEIKIKYVKRKLKTLKSIRPGINEGEFDISVRIQNKGNVELENIVVRDQIPEGFTLTDFTPKDLDYEVIQQGGDSELIIQIREISAQEAVSIRYTCAGSGDYPRTEPQVVVKGRGAGSATSREGGPQPLETKVSEVGLHKKGQYHDFFMEIYKKIDRGLSCKDLGDIIEDARDDFPPGPALHQFMRFARDLKAKAGKMIVGSERDEIITQLKDFQEKYAK